MVLFINVCVRKGSRTKELADYFLSKQNEPYEEVYLNGIDFSVVDESFLCRRDRLIADREFGDSVFDLARQFAEADELVIAAPLMRFDTSRILRSTICLKKTRLFSGKKSFAPWNGQGRTEATPDSVKIIKRDFLIRPLWQLHSTVFCYQTWY